VTTSWSETLDQLEARLDDAARALERPSDSVTPAFEPPAELGPLPAELVPRARGLLTRGSALEQQLTAAAATLRTELHRLPRRPSPRGATARFEIDA
jgi:hypothetical protein